MKPSSRALLNRLFFAPKAVCVQSVTRVKQAATNPIGVESKAPEEMVLAARSILALKRLEKDVLVYRSLGDFEASGKVARVSYLAFKNDLHEVTAEVEIMLARLPQSKLKIELGNALASYRDGEFWWKQIDESCNANVLARRANGNRQALSDNAFQSTIAYTVVIHWRQANRYVKRAEQLIKGRVMLSKSSTPEFRLTPAQSHATFAPSASAR